MALPGPMSASHQPGAPSLSPTPAAWAEPVSAWQTRTVLSPAASRRPYSSYATATCSRRPPSSSSRGSSGVATSTTRVATLPRLRSLGSHVRAISAACSPQVSWKRVGASVGGTVRADAPGAAAGTTRGLQRLREVVDEVVDVLDAGAHADQPGRDAGREQLVLVELRVGRAGGVGDAGLGVPEVHEAGGELERVEERLAGRHAALELEVEDGAGAAREVLPGALEARVVRQLRVHDARDALLLAEPLDEAARVVDVALGAQAQRLEA